MSYKRVFKRVDVAMQNSVILSMDGVAPGGAAVDRLTREEKLAQAERELHLVQAQTCKLRQNARQQAEVEKQRLVREAEQEKERVLAVARQEAEETREAARAAGHAAGLEAGKAAMAAKLSCVLASAEAAVQAGLREQERLVREAEPESIRLAALIAGKVIKEAVALDHEAVVRNIRAAVAKAHEHAELQIFISPDDFALFTKELSGLAAELAGAGYAVSPDPAVAPGGARIESDYGTIDATLATQLEMLTEQLLQLPPSVSPALEQDMAAESAPVAELP